MPKLYHERTWVVPGQQGRGAERVDVPSSPAELAAWLNERHVSPEPCNTQLASEAPELRPGEAAEHAEADASGPKLSAEKIAGHCPACGRSADGTLRLQLGNDLGEIEAWLESRQLGDLWALQRAAELIRDRVRAIGGRVGEGGRA